MREYNVIESRRVIKVELKKIFAGKNFTIFDYGVTCFKDLQPGKRSYNWSDRSRINY